MALLKCSELTLGYEGRRVVEGLSFEVNAGDYLSIVGENGSGKSTLIKAILSLNPPLSGRIEYGDGLKKNEIGYLPQQTAAQKDFPASVYEVVLSGCLNSCGFIPFYSKAQRERARENMRLLGIDGIADKCYRTLSGGQQQRVLLARALCASSRLILLDEPVTALDPKVTEELYSLISSLNADGVTVITVSHDISAAMKYSSHILHMARSPKFFGRAEDYAKSDVGRAYLAGGMRK